VYVGTAPSLSWGGLGVSALEGALIGGAFGLDARVGLLALGALGVPNDKHLWKFALAVGTTPCPARGSMGMSGGRPLSPGTVRG
jgi:hypothetical protein